MAGQGAWLWLGYFFGTIPFVQENFELVIILIVLISVVPMGIEYARSRFNKEEEVTGTAG